MERPRDPGDRRLAARRVGQRRALAAAALAAALLRTGAAAAEGAAPAPASEDLVRAVSGLVFDLDKMIEGQAALGWTVDRYEYEELMAPALMSVCSSTEEAHRGAMDVLSRRITALGGPVEEAFRRHGDIGDLADLLAATRARVLLEEALWRAPAECPFWVRPSPSFRGLETDAYRTTLSLEGGGLLMIQRTAAGQSLFGAGGSGRLLFGRGLNERWTILGGAEFGGNALFDQSENETHIPIAFQVGLPLVLRHVDLTWHYDIEIAGLGYFTQADTRVSPGLRAGGLIGISALRVRHIMPWAGVGLAVEYVFDTGYRPAQWTVKSGARVGFDWDF